MFANTVLSNLQPPMRLSIQINGVCGERANTLMELGYEYASIRKAIAGKGAPKLYKSLIEMHKVLHPSFSREQIANIVFSNICDVQIQSLIEHAASLLALNFPAQLLHDLVLKSNNELLIPVLVNNASDLIKKAFRHSDIVDIIYFCKNDKNIASFLETECELAESGFTREQVVTLLRYTENHVIVKNIARWLPVLDRYEYERETIIAHARDKKVSLLSEFVRAKIECDGDTIIRPAKRQKVFEEPSEHQAPVPIETIADNNGTNPLINLSHDAMVALAALPTSDFEENLRKVWEQPFDQNNANTNVSEEGTSLGSSQRHFGHAVNLFRSQSPVPNCIQRHIIDLQTPTPSM